jgi:hypothetical protein
MEKDKGKRKGMVSHILDTKGWFWCAVDIFRWCLLLILPTKYICRYCTESFEIFTVHATITDGQSVGDLPLEIQTKHVRRYSSREKKKIGALPPSVRLLVFVFYYFISDRINDRKENYRRSIFRQTDSVGKYFTNELCVLHQRNESVGKTV